MNYFVVRPDYLQLAKYYPIGIAESAFKSCKTFQQKANYLKKMTKKDSKEGVPLMIESYFNKKGELKFDEKHIDTITVQFDALLDDYNLLEDRENLLYMIVTMIQSTNSYYDYLQYETYEFNQRLKALSHYILSLKEKPQDKNYELILKSRDCETGILLDNVKITDQELIKWMSKFVIDTVDSGEAPMYLFGICENAMGRKKSSGPSTIRELKTAASIKNEKAIQTKNKQTTGNFCLALIQYLDGETYLKKRIGKNSNDKQLEFLYNICAIFDQIDKTLDPNDVYDTPVKYLRKLIADTQKSNEKKKGETPK